MGETLAVMPDAPNPTKFSDWAISAPPHLLLLLPLVHLSLFLLWTQIGHVPLPRKKNLGLSLPSLLSSLLPPPDAATRGDRDGDGRERRAAAALLLLLLLLFFFFFFFLLLLPPSLPFPQATTAGHQVMARPICEA